MWPALGIFVNLMSLCGGIALAMQLAWIERLLFSIVHAGSSYPGNGTVPYRDRFRDRLVLRHVWITVRFLLATAAGVAFGVHAVPMIGRILTPFWTQVLFGRSLSEVQSVALQLLLSAAFVVRSFMVEFNRLTPILANLGWFLDERMRFRHELVLREAFGSEGQTAINDTLRTYGWAVSTGEPFERDDGFVAQALASAHDEAMGDAFGVALGFFVGLGATRSVLIVLCPTIIFTLAVRGFVVGRLRVIRLHLPGLLGKYETWLLARQQLKQVSLKTS